MSIQKKRAYKSTVRVVQAAQTRSRILSSAKELFQLKGFEGTTIGEVAEAAEVSIPTVYSLFKSKKGILLALMDEVLPPATFEKLVEQVKQEKNATIRLQIAAKMARLMYDAEQKQLGFLRGASAIAPEFLELEKEQEERRYQRQEETFSTMIKKGVLAKGVTFLQARDILWAFTGRDMYRLFVVSRGWSSDEYEKWLANSLISQILAPVLDKDSKKN
jgi:AcrR family transcriptional regulator